MVTGEGLADRHSSVHQAFLVYIYLKSYRVTISSQVDTYVLHYYPNSDLPEVARLVFFSETKVMSSFDDYDDEDDKSDRDDDDSRKFPSPQGSIDDEEDTYQQDYYAEQTSGDTYPSDLPSNPLANSLHALMFLPKGNKNLRLAHPSQLITVSDRGGARGPSPACKK